MTGRFGVLAVSRCCNRKPPRGAGSRRGAARHGTGIQSGVEVHNRSRPGLPGTPRQGRESFLNRRNQEGRFRWFCAARIVVWFFWLCFFLGKFFFFFFFFFF